MKHLKTLFYVAFMAATVLVSCSKDKDAEEEKEKEKSNKQTTGMIFSLTDDVGNPISGASMRLYTNESDWRYRTNQVGTTQVSDGSGKVTFSDLSNIKYYFYAEKGCRSNINGAIVTAVPLTTNMISSFNLVLSGAGSIYIRNTSSNPYRVYLDGAEMFEMSGGTIRSLSDIKTGSYRIRVLQLSGYAIYPTDKSYNVTVTCGGTASVVFP